MSWRSPIGRFSVTSMPAVEEIERARATRWSWVHGLRREATPRLRSSARQGQDVIFSRCSRRPHDAGLPSYPGAMIRRGAGLGIASVSECVGIRVVISSNLRPSWVNPISPSRTGSVA